jgi:hypothetical protein
MRALEISLTTIVVSAVVGAITCATFVGITDHTCMVEGLTVVGGSIGAVLGAVAGLVLSPVAVITSKRLQDRESPQVGGKPSSFLLRPGSGPEDAMGILVRPVERASKRESGTLLRVPTDE